MTVSGLICCQLHELKLRVCSARGKQLRVCRLSSGVLARYHSEPGGEGGGQKDFASGGRRSHDPQLIRLML